MRDCRNKFSTWLTGGLSLAVWGCLLASMPAHHPHYSMDSASYVECARSLRAGNECLHRPSYGLSGNRWITMRLWPPGYPLLIAGTQSFGLPAPIAGVTVSMVSAGLFILLLAWICSRLLPGGVALAVSCVTVSMHAFLTSSTMCLSDAAYLLFATASLACLLGWTAYSGRPWLWLFSAGLFAGLSWEIRYVAISLWAATGCFLLCHALWIRWREVLRMGLCWVSGVIVGAGPLAIRNLLVFGRILPYGMQTSDLSLRENVRITGSVFAGDMTTWYEGVGWLVNRYTFIILLAGGAILVWRWARPVSLSTLRHWLKNHRPHLLFALYLTIYTTVVILARTKYHWGEWINARHLIQVYWIAWIGLAMGSMAFLRRFSLRKSTIQVLVAVGLLALFLLQVRSTQVLYQVQDRLERAHDVYQGSSDKVVTFLTNHVAHHQILLSCRAHLLRIYGDIPARPLLHLTQRYDAPTLLERIQRAGRKGLLWGIVIDDLDGARQGLYGSWIQQAADDPEGLPEFERVYTESPFPIYRYRGRLPGETPTSRNR